MNRRSPRLSVCIPAYNRAKLLPPLLESIAAQDYDDYEIVVSEDASPERAEIAAVCSTYAERWPGRFAYHENARNLGYDGNLRRMFECATGEYCLFMGNDDLLCPGALAAVADCIARHPNIGVLLRSYADFDSSPENIRQEFRYFPDERVFPAGVATVATFFRRSTVISGMVIHREAALRFATYRFDGTLLYQLWVVGRVLMAMDGVSLPRILVLRRNSSRPDFGNSDAERGKFVPGDQTPASSVHFMAGAIRIAEAVGLEGDPAVTRAIVSDYGNYSYPFLAIQARRSKSVFIRYWWSLARLGFWRNPLFHAYFIALLLLGPTIVDRIIGALKRRLGRTPAIGRLYKGRPG